MSAKQEKLDELRRYIASSTNNPSLSMDRMGITNEMLEELLPFMASKLRNLTALSLKNNR